MPGWGTEDWAEFDWGVGTGDITPEPTAFVRNVPEAVLEISYTDPGDTPVWTDESAYLRDLSISRGRNSETESVEPGRATVLLDNRTGRFDPNFVDGSNYPNIRPVRRLRLSAIVDTFAEVFVWGSDSALGTDSAFGGAITTTVPLFTGDIESWELATQSQDATAVVTAVDGFKWLKDLVQLPQNNDVESSSDRINLLLDNAGWPADERAISEDATHLVYHTQGSYTNFMEHANLVAAGEAMAFFIDREGNATLRGPQEPTRTYGDGPGEDRYRGFQNAPYDDTRIFNHIDVTSSSQSKTHEDTLSIARYRYHAREFATWLDTSEDAWIAALAMRYWLAYREPRIRVTALGLGTRSTDWLHVFSQDIQDSIAFKTRPIYGGTFEQTSVIEGITIRSSTKFDWRVDWTLSARAPDNMLSVQGATFDESTDVSMWTGTNATLSRAAGDGESGAGLQLTVVADGNASAVYTDLPVRVGYAYIANAWFGRNTSDPDASALVQIIWKDAARATLSTSDGNTVTAHSNSEFEQSVCEAVAPASAAYATVQVRFLSVLTGDRYLADSIFLYEVASVV
jgi:hypothetical protein